MTGAQIVRQLGDKTGVWFDNWRVEAVGNTLVFSATFGSPQRGVSFAYDNRPGPHLEKCINLAAAQVRKALKCES